MKDLKVLSCITICITAMTAYAVKHITGNSCYCVWVKISPLLEKNKPKAEKLTKNPSFLLSTKILKGKEKSQETHQQ